MMMLLYLLDLVLFVLFAVNVIYVLFFSIAAHFSAKDSGEVAPSSPAKRIVILIPAYREDAVIGECVQSCLNQDYPRQAYHTVVISDRMTDHTNRALAQMGAQVVVVHFENSTKAKALNHAMGELGEGYDLALVLDADNTIGPDFLSDLNRAFSAGKETKIIQAHRRAKNLNTNLALLDAVSEEINNSIFRQGHANVGLSAALIGSGMCFDYALFRQTMLSIDAVGGFDRALELTLLRDGYKINYLPDAYVLDEKVQYHRDFSRQRRRWLSAQLHYFLTFAREVPAALRRRNWDFCDKFFQQMSTPRLMLIGFCLLLALVTSFAGAAWSVKWWMLLAMLICAMMIAIPKYLYQKRLLLALLQLPYTFLLMTLNIFRLRGANKKFIHTSHGIKKA